ncbi:L,D-transpeptidase [Streptomyces sp. NBC_01077]|uniref:L,D-transpeptidase n=1 Tax=Streptomyces sp. NBC_01077 TaxID=2903746 RepID=UPI0038666E1F|nr:L,D-transpeptidase [Streptomyces sp. NBC_01077]WSV44365.1 L,D-transpeptidase [Streptomyces sp. NBC_01077]
MNGESIGIPKDSPDAYDLNVRHAIRVTWSVEYLHAAPWSADAHGVENDSHGCTGMSTGNAAWLYNTLNVGDVVRVINGSGQQMSAFENGSGDWNLNWREWRAGSALPSSPARYGPLLRPSRPENLPDDLRFACFCRGWGCGRRAVRAFSATVGQEIPPSARLWVEESCPRAPGYGRISDGRGALAPPLPLASRLPGVTPSFPPCRPGG